MRPNKKNYKAMQIANECMKIGCSFDAVGSFPTPDMGKVHLCKLHLLEFRAILSNKPNPKPEPSSRTNGKKKKRVTKKKGIVYDEIIEFMKAREDEPSTI